MTDTTISHLDALEAESIHILREVAAEFEQPVLLFSGGKDSVVMLKLAEKAFWPAQAPVPGHARRHRPQLRRGARLPRPAGRASSACRLVVAQRAGRRSTPAGRRGDRTHGDPQPAPDRDAARRHRGARLRRRLRRRAPRRGEGPRQGAGLLVPRRVRPVGPEEPASGAVEPLQRPAPQGEHIRVFPHLELDRAGRLAVHRARGDRDPADLLRPRARGLRARRHAARRSPRFVHAARATSEVEDADGALPHRRRRDLHRLRSSPPAATPRTSSPRWPRRRITERGATRADDRVSEAAMEDRKKEGYF